MIDVEAVSVGKDLAKVYKSLDKVGRGGLRKELRKQLGAVSKPVRTTIRDSERDTLPSGMSKYARLPTQTVSVTVTGAQVNIKQRRAGSDLWALNKGRLRHPVFGNFKRWVTQRIRPGMWTTPLTEAQDGMRRDLIDTMKSFVERETNQ